MSILLGLSAVLVSYVTLYARTERQSVNDAAALALAEGGIDKAVYELNQNPSYAGESNTALGGGVFTVVVSTVDTNTKAITATGYVPDSVHPSATKTVKVHIALNSDTISFHYGIQVGTGGITMSNSSKVVGNVFSSGPVVGTNSNLVYGDVISTGATGLVYGIHATSSIYAHTIGGAAQATEIDKNAYYANTITNTTVHGTSYPGSADQNPVPLPISDDQITDWENQAAAGGTISSCDKNGDYTISASQSLGPKKITCNLIVKSSSGILTVTGPIWVTGNITAQTGPTIKMDPNLGSQNVAIVADNPANTTGSGIITIGQSTIFQSSGSSGSFVFLISQNGSAEQGGATAALSLSQGASALVAYASHGLVTMNQSVGVKEVTGYQISLAQTATVTYDTGLPNTIFESGPGGGWAFVPGTYAIVK